MNLSGRERSGYPRNFALRAVLLSILSMLFLSTVMARDYYFHFSGETYSEALICIADSTDANIAFDSEIMSQSSVNRTISGENAGELLDNLLRESEYGYIYKYGSYLIIDKHDQNAPNDEIRGVNGVLLDAHTGKALPLANIYIPSLNAHLYASSDGSFLIPPTENESQDIYLSYVGYQSIDTTVSMDKSTEPHIFFLEQKSQLLEPVHIETPRLPMLGLGKNASHYSLRPANFINLPSYGETDIFSSLELLPGISYTQNSSELSIRGGAGDQNLVLFDGFTLYNLDHYFGAFSALNPNVIQDLQVYKGGFDSRYGERVSGIIDAKGKSGDSLVASAYGGINLLSANLTVEVPVNQKFNMLVSGRMGYSSFFSNFLIENIYEDQGSGNFPGRNRQVQSEINPDYQFYDFNTKLRYQIRENEEIAISAYYGRDELGLEDNISGINISANIFDHSQWDNYGAGITWSRKWNNSFSSSIQAGGSGYVNRYKNQVNILVDSSNFNVGPVYEMPFPAKTEPQYRAWEQNSLGDIYLSIRNSYKLNSAHTLDFGMIARNQYYSLNSDSKQTDSLINPKGSSGLWSLYIQDEITLNSNFMVKPGLRANYHSLTGDMYFEPRLLVNYTFDEGLRFKFSGGRYHQFVSKLKSNQIYGYNREFWVLSDNENHSVLTSNHLILGAGYHKGCIIMDVEAYYKTFNGLQQLITLVDGPVQNDFRGQSSPKPAGPITQSLIATGSGRSYGLDFLFKYRNEHYQSWVSYSLGRSIQNFDLINDGADIPAPVDRPHALDITQMYSAGKWNFSLVYLFSTGQPYVVANQKQDDIAIHQIFSRLPNYHRVDVSTNYNFKIKEGRFRVGLSVINLLDRQNYYDIDRRNFLFNSASYEETSIIKSQGITPNVFLQFRF